MFLIMLLFPFYLFLINFYLVFYLIKYIFSSADIHNYVLSQSSLGIRVEEIF